MWPWGPMGPHHFWGSGWNWLSIVWMIVNMLFWLALLVGAVVLVVRLVRRSRAGGAGRDRGPGADLTPQEIVQRRYARGEITREQYLDILADIEDNPARRDRPPAG